MVILICIIAALVVLWFLMLMPRLKHPENLSSYYSKKYAHRGLYDNNDIPENSLASFKAAVDNGYSIELDVHLTHDGKVAVFHDYSLMRMCKVDKRIEELDACELKDCYLNGTNYNIPMLSDVLQVVDGNATLLIEIKATLDNAFELCKATMDILNNYTGDYCIESFDPRVLLWFRFKKPGIVRGQLSGYINRHGDYFNANGKRLNPFGDFLLRNLLINCVGKPDFIAYREDDKKNINLRVCKLIFRLPIFYWTIKDDNYDDMAENDTIIFEKR